LFDVTGGQTRNITEEIAVQRRLKGGGYPVFDKHCPADLAR
jgi:hypothetical protein